MAQNITDSLKRIKQLRDQLAAHGADLDLSLTSGVSTLQKVVDEYNKIVKQADLKVEAGTSASALKVDNTTKVVIPAGYYSKEFVVTGKNSQADQDEAVQAALDALAEDIKKALPDASSVVAGASTFALQKNPSTGEYQIVTLDGEVGAVGGELSANGESDSKLTVKTKNGDSLLTNIPYYAGGDTREVKVTVKESKDDESYVETETLEAGYYASGVTIVPVLDTQTTNKVINVEVGKIAEVTSKDGLDLTPSDGFDYVKSAKILVQQGSAKVTATVSGNTVKLTPENEEGWVSETTFVGDNVSKNADGSILVTLPTNVSDDAEAELAFQDLDKDGNPELVVTIPEGVYTSDTTVPVVLDGENLSRVVVSEEVSIDEDGNASITVPKGVLTEETTINLNKSQLTVSSEAIDEATPVTITSPVTYISASEGYTAGEAKKLVIPMAEPSLVPEEQDGGGYKIILSVPEGGWLASTSESVLDLTNDFAPIADAYANGLIDAGVEDSETGEVVVGEDVTSVESTAGQVVFTYAANLDEVDGGVQIKAPSGNSRYFTSAKVDLSELIKEIDEI